MGLQGKIEAVTMGLELPSSEQATGESKVLPNVKHVREARELSTLMGNLKDQLARVSKETESHSRNTGKTLDHAIAKFRAELQDEVRSQVRALSAASSQI